VTIPGSTPDEPGTRREDMRELHDPYDLPFPDVSDHWPPAHAEYVIVVDQLRSWQPGSPLSLAELLETRPTPEPEPDREAEP
jgi:hypothetical protein